LNEQLRHFLKSLGHEWTDSGGRPADDFEHAGLRHALRQSCEVRWRYRRQSLEPLTGGKAVIKVLVMLR